MTMTDPVADMLTRLRNANSAHHDSVSLPSSKLKTNIAEILKQEGYISSWEVSDARVGQTLTLTLKYGPNRERSIAGIKRVSKPGLRVYAKSTELPRVLAAVRERGLTTSLDTNWDPAERWQGVAGCLPHLDVRHAGRGDVGALFEVACGEPCGTQAEEGGDGKNDQVAGDSLGHERVRWGVKCC